jgi:hypothetical protein
VSPAPSRPERGPDGPAPRQAGPGAPVGGLLGLPTDSDSDDDVDVLYLAGQIPAAPGEWLLITAVDGLPGAEFTARILPATARQAHGGDVLVYLAPQLPTGYEDAPRLRVETWAAIDGLMIPVAAWDRGDPDRWPEQIRASATFAMSVLTELEEHGADLGPSQVIDLDDTDTTAPAGIPVDATFGTARPGQAPGRS